MKQNDRMQKRENIVGEGNNLGRFIELATTSKKYVISSNLHEFEE